AMLVLVTQRSVAPPGPGVSMLLAWSALLLALAWTRRPHLLALSAAVLLGAGLLVQLDMGLGARDTAWLRHFQNTAALLALGLPLGLLLFSGFARGAVSRPLTERLLLVLAGAALAALLAQVWLGDETGVFELQPVEFAKLALAALSAHCLALAADAGAAGAGKRDWRFWLRMAAPVLLFVFLLAAALVRVDDYSPLVLLLVWAGAMALAWCCASGRKGAAWLLGGVACVALLGGAALQRSAGALGEAGFYPERFQVWSDPGLHPHTGQQMLLGLRAVAQGGWFGAGGALGLDALGQPAGEALAIPAVQDDFAPSWLLHRHGLAAALALWSVQALFLAALLRTAAQAWRRACEAGDFRRAWLGRFQCFALCGGAAFVAGHLLLSWGTNLAMFPIMGQPMSFLSSGGSHLLFFICPLLAFGMASVQFHEESQSCRSMSNTKS
ncbi:FtsW/RodA/SpoVE family cell cycle protein, partial [Massilia sp. ST3]|uniref:FtsW/RodA/SpoVE family cell cycle protein n=1 Tax=Massilia sp. ST3 TaxID=2824903 RepID=UPI001B81F5E8